MRVMREVCLRHAFANVCNGSNSTVGDQAARGRKTERSEERHYVRWVGQSFGERPKDLHFGGTVRQPFFLATLAVRGKVRRVAV
jgi:hypothetical protein